MLQKLKLAALSLLLFGAPVAGVLVPATASAAIPGSGANSGSGTSTGNTDPTCPNGDPAPNGDVTQCGSSSTQSATSGSCNTIGQCDLISKYINPAVNFLAALVGVAVVISIIIGGIQYGSSAGDPQKASAAKARIRNAIIALVTFAFLFVLLKFLLPGADQLL